MTRYKEFQGKSLDEAIEEACRHFDLKRDKLELEIVSGGSTGIFGLVGVKKAIVKARPRDNFMNAPEQSDSRAEKPEKVAAPNREPIKEETLPTARDEATEQQASAGSERDKIKERPVKDKPRKPKQAKTRAKTDKPRQERPKKERPKADVKPRVTKKPRDNGQSDRVERPERETPNLDPKEVEEAVREVTLRILDAILPDPQIRVTFDSDRVNVFIDDEEHSGLIIGREGQTLSSIQYLVNRIVSRKMQAPVRVQIDTGDYRERQDQKLKHLALHLADKAINTSKTQSTKPMSSYHRRVVHLALQDMEEIFTRSKGEGSMKRVLIVPKRKSDNRSQGHR